jgi:hypothetical protein
MFTADHSWLSRQFSMCVLCILFVFVLCIVSNVYSCPFLVVPSVFYVCVMYFVQEWAAVNIGYNTQNEDKQNTQHTHRKPTGKPGMGSCKHWIQYTERGQFLVVPSVFYVCVVYFVCLRSVNCIQCLQLPIPGCPVSFLCLCCVFCFVCLRSVYCIQCLQLPIPGTQT